MKEIFDMIYESMDEIDSMCDDVKFNYSLKCDAFLSRYSLYSEGVCSIDDVLSVFTESNNEGFMEKIITSIKEFLKSISEKIQGLFLKFKTKESIDSLKKNSKPDDTINFNADHTAFIKNNKKIMSEFNKCVRSTNPDNAEQSIKKMDDLIAKEKMNFKKLSKPATAVAAALGIVSAVKCYDYYQKLKEYDKNNITQVFDTIVLDKNGDPIKLGAWNEFIRRVNVFIHTNARSVTWAIGNFISSIGKAASNLKNKVVGSIKESTTYKGTKEVYDTVTSAAKTVSDVTKDSKFAKNVKKYASDTVSQYTKPDHDRASQILDEVERLRKKKS